MLRPPQMPKSVTYVLGRSVTYVPGRTKEVLAMPIGSCGRSILIRTPDRRQAGSTTAPRSGDGDRPQGDPERSARGEARSAEESLSRQDSQRKFWQCRLAPAAARS